MKQNLDFDPFFLFKSAFQQTVFSTFLFYPVEPLSVTKYIPLKDADILAVEVSTPPDWKETDLTVILVHGLCGSHKSGILVRMAKKLYGRNVRSVRVNLRGSGSGRGMAKNIYHSGSTEDLLEVIKTVKDEYPFSRMVLIGYSLSGNMVLKLAGELGDKAAHLIEKVLSLSPPVDLKESTDRFEQKENRIYLKYFIGLLWSDIKYLQKKFHRFKHIKMNKNTSLTEFNKKVIVPNFGFKNVDDYYQKCSAKFFIPKIKVPTKILFCNDDPLVPSTALDNVQLPANVAVYYTDRGGHLGYLTSPLHKHGFYWLDGLLLDWIFNP